MSIAYFIEGIPGSGKTTYAQRLHDYLVSQGKQVELYNEGDLHPIDLAWCSITSKNNFDELCETHSNYREQILSHSKFLGNTVVTAYTKVKVNDADVSLYDDFSVYEIYRTNDFQRFKDTHLSLWKTFNTSHKKNTIYIFECIFLQNHINELILKFTLTKKQMLLYFQDLIGSLNDIETHVLYIKPMNIKQTFDFVIKERKSYNINYKDWIELVIEYLEKTKEGPKLGYSGYQGALRYFTDRQEIECKLIPKLNTKSIIFEHHGDYNKVFHEITNYIK